jgi:protoporphyrinogen oxidase
LKLAVIGAGPVGLALALHAAAALPDAEITLFDARPSTKDVGGDPRTLALRSAASSCCSGWARGVRKRAGDR